MASDFQWTHSTRRTIDLRHAGMTIALLMQAQ